MHAILLMKFARFISALERTDGFTPECAERVSEQTGLPIHELNMICAKANELIDNEKIVEYRL